MRQPLSLKASATVHINDGIATTTIFVKALTPTGELLYIATVVPTKAASTETEKTNQCFLHSLPGLRKRKIFFHCVVIYKIFSLNPGDYPAPLLPTGQ